MGPGDSIENDVDGVFARDAHLLARLEVLDRKRAGGNLVFSEEDDIGNRKLVGVLNLCLELLCLGVELGADAGLAKLGGKFDGRRQIVGHWQNQNVGRGGVPSFA